jgi:putrescine transport system substrate-binding protein
MSRFVIRFTRFAALSASLLALNAVAAPKEVLNIYNWSDYIGDHTIANFEKETGIKVRYDNYDNNEIVHTKLTAGKSGYDIVVPSAQWAKLQIQGKLFQPLDKSKIANLKNLDPAIMKHLAANDPDNAHLVPWMWGATVVGINVDKVTKALGGPLPDNAWDLLFKPEVVSKLKGCGVSMLDSADEIFPAALRYLGKPAYSSNPDDYKAAGELLKSVRPSIKLFSSSGYINDLAGGSLCVVMGFNGDINIAAARAKEAKTATRIEALIPKTGAVLMFDSMAIPKDAKHVESAYKFIDYILRPEVNAELTNKVFYANPVPAAAKFIQPEIANNKTVFLSAEQMATMVPPDMVNNDIRRLRTRLFTTFKTGR